MMMVMILCPAKRKLLDTINWFKTIRLMIMMTMMMTKVGVMLVARMKRRYAAFASQREKNSQGTAYSELSILRDHSSEG